MPSLTSSKLCSWGLAWPGTEYGRSRKRLPSTHQTHLIKKFLKAHDNCEFYLLKVKFNTKKIHTKLKADILSGTKIKEISAWKFRDKLNSLELAQHGVHSYCIEFSWVSWSRKLCLFYKQHVNRKSKSEIQGVFYKALLI